MNCVDPSYHVLVAVRVDFLFITNMVTSCKETAKETRSTAARMKMIYALLATVLVGGVHCNGPLPEYMMGNFVLETSEGFNDYMYEIGVDWFTRKVV